LTIRELKKIVDLEVDRLGDEEDLTVMITLKNVSLGARAGTSIKSVFKGFDWEHGQLRIETEADIITNNFAKFKDKSLTNNQ